MSRPSRTASNSSSVITVILPIMFCSKSLSVFTLLNVKYLLLLVMFRFEKNYLNVPECLFCVSLTMLHYTRARMVYFKYVEQWFSSLTWVPLNANCPLKYVTAVMVLWATEGRNVEAWSVEHRREYCNFPRWSGAAPLAWQLFIYYLWLETDENKTINFEKI